MRSLSDDDVVRDATIEQTSQAVFSAGRLGALGDYISEPTKLNAVTVCMRQIARRVLLSENSSAVSVQ
jgi:hypothetical protein